MIREYNLSYDEIYYASTQKSATSGSIGFGIRTYTEGMPVADVNEITNLFSPGYPVPTAKSVTMAQLQQNPAIVLDYPKAYEYRILTLGDGSKRYVLARTVYVGIEYGYFCNGSAKRAGSNFFTHMLVFKQIPPFALLDDIVEGRVCLPKDGTCNPDNPEWQMLLAGEPQLLQKPQPLHFEVEENVNWSKDPRFVTLTKAILQAYMNEKQGKDPMLQKVMIKTTISESPELVRFLSHIPDRLMSLFPFSSNVMRGTMPNNYRIAMMNEWNTSQQFPDNYIFVDFTSGKTSNVEDNFFFGKLQELAMAGDVAKLTKLISYFQNVDYNRPQEYPFLYDIFLSIQTADELSLGKIDNVFIDKSIQLNLPKDDSEKLWTKINATFKKNLIQTENPCNIIKVVEIAHYCRQKNCQLLHFDTETIKYMTDMFFKSEKNLNGISSKCSPDMLLPLVDLGQVTEDNLFDALRNCSKTSVWTLFVKQYYSSNLQKQMDRILGELMASQSLRDNDREQLRETFYPMATNEKTLLQWFLDNPDAIKSYKNTVGTICSKQDNEVFSSLINARDSFKKEVSETLSDTAREYYRTRIGVKSNIDIAVSDLVALCGRIDSNTFCNMGLDTLFKTYTDHLFENPMNAKQAVVRDILMLNLPKSESNGLVRLSHIALIMEHQEFSDVSLEDLMFDLKQKNHDNEYSLKLFRSWINASRRSYDKVCQYTNLVSWKIMTDREQKAAIVIVWESKMYAEDRINAIMYIIGCAGWKKEDLQKFIDSCNASSKLSGLASAIEKENTFFKKVVRFFKKLFAKKK